MEIKTDFLVIGSGIAGLMFALKVADSGTVAMVTKKNAMDSNTNKAQGGIASVFGKKDSFKFHIQDTMVSGDGLCDPDVVSMVVQNGPRMNNQLTDLGVQFNLNEKQQSLALESKFDL